MRSSYVCLSILVLSTWIPAMAAQFGTVQGELTCDNCRSYTNVVVEVSDFNRNPVGSFVVNHSGTFAMSGVSDGNYVMTVRGANGAEITSQSINVRANSGPVSIRVPESASNTAGSGNEGSVSLHQLSHKVPKAAKKEFEKAANAGADNSAVIRHLETAVQIDPNYMEALNNLGSRYILVDQFEKAYAVLMKAQRIDPASARVQTNLAVVLLAQRKLEDAERAARRAFQLASNDSKARYILALALYNRQQFTEETVGLLRSSADQFPNANVALASVYAIQGKKSEARSLLNGYLAAGHAAQATQVRQLLATLQ